MTAPGPGSGKLATCMSNMYHDQLNGIKSGYAKFETFPVWNLPLHHPVNLAYEAATAGSRRCQYDRSLPPPNLRRTTVNYNRDIEIFPVLKRMLERILGTSPYASPTDMGVNMVGFAMWTMMLRLKLPNKKSSVAITKPSWMSKQSVSVKEL